MSAKTHIYDDRFFDYIETGARQSALATIKALEPLMPSLQSVVDIGSGQGVWAKAFLDQPSINDVIAVDGDYVNRDRLHIPVESFVAHDLTTPLDLKKRFDLVVSLEVAEHLPADVALAFIETLTRHSQRVLFSAAIPGQGGEHHINERPLSYWRELFGQRGYQAFDAVRPTIVENKAVEPWYRYNTMLYVHQDAIASLPAEIARTALDQAQDIEELAPASWRLRCALLRRLPRPAIEALAKAKHAYIRKHYERMKAA